MLLVFGLQGMTGSGASLLLNAEAVLTAVIAWVVSKNVDRRVALGLVCIVAGGIVPRLGRNRRRQLAVSVGRRGPASAGDSTTISHAK